MVVPSNAAQELPYVLMNVQAVTEVRIIEIEVERLRGIGQQDAAFSWALACEVGHGLLETIDALAEATFGTVRGRLAHHLLDLAHDVDDQDRLVVRATHQALADSVGTVREVVARNLGELKAKGYLTTRRGEIVIERPEALAVQVGQWLPRQR